MAGPSVMVRVLGDLTGLGKAMDDTSTKGTTAAGHLHSAFSGVLDTLNKTGVLGPFQEVLEGAEAGLEKVAEAGKHIGPALLGAGAAVAGIGMALQAMGSKDAAAHQQLQQAVEATGKSYDGYNEDVEKAIKAQEKFGNTAADTQDALKTLTQATNDPKKAMDMLGEASDLAASKHESLSTAAESLGKAYNGNTRVFKEFGVQVTKNKDGTADTAKAVADLGAKLTGQASAGANTFSGHLKAMKTQLEDSVATFANKYGPAITTAGAAMTGLGATIEVAKGAQALFKDQQILTTVATQGQAAATWLLNTALLANPIMLVVIALVALVGIFVLAYEKVGWFRNAVDDMGRIAKAAFDLIVNAGKEVFGWLEQHWPLILAILTGPFGLAAYEIATHITSILNLIRDIPGKIEGIASGMWNGISHAFKAMVNDIIDIWNKLHFTLPKIDAGPIHLGGETIGVPHIPHMAQGGLITGDGLIYAHAGEAITPADKVGRTAPAVHVEHLEVSTELDVEAFMKRAAWVAQTARL